MTAILEVKGLTTHIDTDDGTVRAVTDLSLRIDNGEVVAIVGESGSGKSVTALSLMRLLPTPPARIVSGSIRFDNRELANASEEEMYRIRGREIAMIFQEPMSALNPVLTIGEQISEPIIIHQKLSRRDAARRAIEMLRLVQIPEPERRLQQYPHELSGGMRQRVVIAIALSCNPRLLIADEPTTALDVTVQAQILELMRELKAKIGAAIILITHDLGVVAEMAQRVVVMYAGRVVEEAAVEDIFRQPLHPYTLGLMRAVPKLGSSLTGEKIRLAEIPGTVPSLKQPILGCPFAPRCDYATSRCLEEAPRFEAKSGLHHKAACHHSDVLQARSAS